MISFEKFDEEVREYVNVGLVTTYISFVDEVKKSSLITSMSSAYGVKVSHTATIPLCLVRYELDSRYSDFRTFEIPKEEIELFLEALKSECGNE